MTAKARRGAPRLALLTFVSIASLVLACFVPRAARAASPSHGHLARSTEWLRLVHYHATFWGGSESEIDGAELFLAAHGRSDPEAELEATVIALARPVVRGREDAHAACRFPARRTWLARVLGPDEATHLQAPACKALGRFRSGLDLEGATVVYASNALSNPASALGHTFLRLRKRRAPGTPAEIRAESLDNATDFRADIDTKNPLLFGLKGLSGMFRGYFRVHPFSEEVHKYTETDSRDMWEYELALTPDETEMLALHLWELQQTQTAYYYLTANCSYYVVAVLEAASPRIDVLSELKPFVLPVDTIKLLAKTPGLVRHVAYRPSRSNQARAWTLHADSTRPTPWEKSPERGHGTTRFDVGVGTTTQYGTGFAAAGFRVVLHDLLDPPDGEPELVQVQFLDTHLRYDLGRRKLTLDELTFAELFSLRPLRPGDVHTSWRVRAAGRRLHDRGCVEADCFAHGLDVSYGLTLATNRDHLAVFLMADVYGLMSPRLDGVGESFVRAGVGPFGGVRLKLWHQMVALVTGTYSYLPGSHLHTTFDVRAGLRASLGRHVALGVDAALQPASAEAQLRSFVYF